MRKLFIVVFLITFQTFYSQNEFATVNVYRPKAMMGSAVPVDVLINGSTVPLQTVSGNENEALGH